MSKSDLPSEVLELLRTMEVQNRTAKLSEMATELNCSVGELTRALEFAIDEGLVERSDGTLTLTDKGRMQLQEHRERYIHDRHGHGLGFTGRLTKILEGTVRDWRTHWRAKHGFDDSSVDDFYRGIRNLEGHVEDTQNLTSLQQGEKGVVVFAFGGRGLVRRLAEMGLTPGTEVTVVRSAPLRGPIEVSVRGVFLALGYGVASKVFVTRVGRGG